MGLNPNEKPFRDPGIPADKVEAAPGAVLEPTPEEIFAGAAPVREFPATIGQSPGEQALAIVQDGIATGEGLDVAACEDLVALMTGRLDGGA